MFNTRLFSKDTYAELETKFMGRASGDPSHLIPTEIIQQRGFSLAHIDGFMPEGYKILLDEYTSTVPHQPLAPLPVAPHGAFAPLPGAFAGALNLSTVPHDPLAPLHVVPPGAFAPLPVVPPGAFAPLPVAPPGAFAPLPVAPPGAFAGALNLSTVPHDPLAPLPVAPPGASPSMLALLLDSPVKLLAPGSPNPDKHPIPTAPMSPTPSMGWLFSETSDNSLSPSLRNVLSATSLLSDNDDSDVMCYLHSL